MNTNKTTETKEALNSYNIANVKDGCMIKAIALCDIMANACNSKDTECIDMDCMRSVCMMLNDEIATIWNIENPENKKTLYFNKL